MIEFVLARSWFIVIATHWGEHIWNMCFSLFYNKLPVLRYELISRGHRSKEIQNSIKKQMFSRCLFLSRITRRGNTSRGTEHGPDGPTGRTTDEATTTNNKQQAQQQPHQHAP